jgi:hypothetical protein
MSAASAAANIQGVGDMADGVEEDEHAAGGSLNIHTRLLLTLLLLLLLLRMSVCALRSR